eukprot:NODE_6792_length_500_cov_11.013405_g6626_i0.p1 GENE.NODE_6792_length_500_cov_11.013405_g6626_i0~~NODE_6792_length_500_cov_11.013405_g6626_i0.p1  ORF type:complete len:113 (+),score=14.58 NODE_6792_length_500_cov_11.013405_g6626_i0:77-415(+)
MLPPSISLRPVLGIEVLEVDHPCGEIHLTVMNVNQGGAADHAGLRVNDIITRWDHTPITRKADFAAAVRGSNVGAEVVIVAVVVIQVVRRPQHHTGPMTTAVEYFKMTIRGS